MISPTGTLPLQRDSSCIHGGPAGAVRRGVASLDIPSTGRTISAQEFALYRITNNKITHSWGNLDTAVQTQLT